MRARIGPHPLGTRGNLRDGACVSLAIFLAMIASVGLSSCAGYVSPAAGGGTQTGNASSGVLSPSSSFVSFGNVAVGSTAMQTVSVTNTGKATVSISQAAIIGSGFTMVNGSGATSLPVGQSASLQIQFAPTSEGSDTATLTISSDASNSALGIPLSGTGTEAVIAFSPASLNFNNVPVGQSSSQNVTITNNGNSNLTFSSVAISGSGFAMSGLNPLPTIAGGQSAMFSIQFAPTSTTGATGSVVFTDNAGNSPQTLTLVGSAVASGSTLAANPGSVNFGNVVVGTSSSPQTITLTNSGTATITINQVSTTGSGFSASGLSAGQTIAAGATANFSASFAPTVTGTASGSITITSTATNGTLSIALSGTGTQGALSANPASISFGNMAIGSSAAVAVTLSNTGTAAVSITGSSITGTGFSMSTLAAQTLNPGQTTSFNVTFAPTTATSATGSVSITSNAPGSSLTIALSGTGTQGALSANPASISFGNVAVGSTSAPTSVTLSNTGTAAVSITGSSITGTGFSMSTLAAQTLNPGQTVSFNVTFAPTTATSATGSVSITSNAPGSPLKIALSGTGTQGALSANPASISFGNVAVGSTSAPTSVTLSNTGTAAVSITGSSITGTGFRMSMLAAQTLNPGQTASFSVTFTPSATSATGSVSITSNAPGSPLTIALSGTGIQPIMVTSPTSLNFNNVPVGQTSSQNVTLTNSGSSSLTLSSATISGSGFTMSGLTLPMMIAAGQSAMFSIQFAPTSTTGATGSVVFTDNAGNSPQTLTLVGSAVASGSTLAANPGSVNFGNVVVGTSSSPQTITLTNSGTATITINQVSTTGSGFSASGLSAGQTIAAGATANFSASFAPTVTGTASGSITITSTATNGTLSIALSGTGTQGALSANPASISFGNMAIGSSAAVAVTLSNTGTAAVSITGSGITGTGFSMSTLAAQTLNPGQTTSFNVTFAPTTATSATGSVSITSNAPGSPLKIALSGTGTQPQISANPTSISFGTVTVGNSNSQTITLTNNGNATLTFSQIAVAGTGFTQTGLSTSTTIAAGGSTTFNAVFTPSSATTASGSITLTTNGTLSPLVINLSGTGATATLSLGTNPTSLSFGNVGDGTDSSLTTSLTNNGNSNITISGVTVTGAGFSASGVPNGTVLTPGQSSTLTVTFAPTTAGAVSGASVTITSNATNSPTTVSLSGTGTDSVLLQWAASPTTGVTYNVYRGTSSGRESATPLNTSPVSTTSYTDTNVTSGQTYFYIVEAVDSGGNSTASNEVQVTP